MSLRAAIADDEPLARRRLRALLVRDPDLEIVGECKNGLEVGALIASARVDIVVLDIVMPGLDGLSIIERIPAPLRPHVVLVTAHDRFAVRAFDVHVVDYVLKPYADARFATAVERAKAAALARAPGGPRRLAIRDRRGITLVELASIDWIESADNYVQIHTGGDCHLLRTTLSELEQQLPGGEFTRVHRRAIVNLRCIRELRCAARGDCRVVLATGVAIPVGRRYRAVVKQRLGA